MPVPELKRGDPPPKGYRYSVPYFVLIVGLLSTLFFSYYVWRTGEAKDLERFNTTTQELTTYVRGRPRLYIEVLRAASGLFAASPAINPGQFQKFVERLELADQYPGVEGIGFLVREKRDAKNLLVNATAQPSVADFELWPIENQDAFVPTLHFEPLDRRAGKAALAFHIDANCKIAMKTARDTGLPATTARVMLPTADNQKPQAGFLIYAPIYENDRTPKTIDERRAAVAGFVYSQFRASEFLKAVLEIKNTRDIDLRLYDGPDPSAENLLHDTASDYAEAIDTAPRFTTVNRVEVGGRTWTIGFASRPSFGFTSNKFSLFLTTVGGTLMTLLLFGLTHSQVNAGAAAEAAAADLRLSESKVRKTLSDRERAEEALRESEERYRELIENANDIVFTLDLDGNVTSMNKAVESVTGYTQTELVGMNMSEFLTEASTVSARSMTERKLAGEERTNYEVEIRAKDGRVFTLEISSRLAMSGGQPVGVQGVARDITMRRRAEEALREADLRALSEYERLLERVAGLAQILGTARDLIAIFHGLREFTQQSVPCDGLFVSLYDAARDVRIACYGWGDGVEVDTAELPPMPVNYTGPNSRAVRNNEVVITNDYQKQTLGHPAVLVGPDNGLRPQSSLSAPMAVMGRIIGTIEVQTYEPGAYLQEHATAMRMAANLTAVAIENVRLLERESTARALAEDSNRLKDEFLATVSHELRTPLTAILGWSRMLQSGSLETETAARAIETIKRNAKSQAQIIDDILDVSRIITGNLYLELNPVDLAPVLEAAINVVRPTADAKNIQIEVDFEAEPAAVPGDTNRLQQVFWNLLSNAIKFTPVGGRVTVTLHQIESQVEVSVTDTGQGIVPDFLPFVFDRFRQADSTSTRQHGGLGLGLAIARHFVEIHGGSISASSDGKGTGAKFTVRLPLIGSIAEVASINAEDDGLLAEQPLAQQVLAGLTVLLVDDDEDTLELLSAALVQRSAKVTTCSSAAAALKSIKDSRPDVLISDIAMPGEDGYQLIQQVRGLNLRPPLPAIAITAYAKDEDKLRALAAGYNRYLSKPIELGEFIGAVAELSRLELSAT
jgi:PAS domain S-box-containing protein